MLVALKSWVGWKIKILHTAHISSSDTFYFFCRCGYIVYIDCNILSAWGCNCIVHKIYIDLWNRKLTQKINRILCG